MTSGYLRGSNNLLAGASGQGGYTIDESLRFNASQSSYLSWTPASAGNRRTWTYSTWVKRGSIGVASVYPHFGISAGTADNSSVARSEMLFTPNSNIVIGFNPTGSSWYESTTNAVFRDPSAWYHIVVSIDTTQATSTNRVKLWVNGALQTFSSYSAPPQNTDLTINNTTQHVIGDYVAGLSTSTYNFDGYLTEVNFIDGQALDASSFGEFDATTGVWKPKEYTGTYGTNGFYLPMKLDNTTEGFNTVTYLGTGSKQNITGVGFSPDLIWIKNRIGANSHYLYDSVRGANKSLTSNSTSAEDTASGQLDSFNTDGFTVPSDTAGYNNYSGRSYVAWCWDAGNTTVTNTDGSITSSVRANPTYGFSVVSYTGNSASGATVGHNLSTPPKIVIHKNRTNANDWVVDVGNITGTAGNALRLNNTSAITNNIGILPNKPSASVFYVSYDGGVFNASGNNYIAYCFSEVSGYSKFGSYSGTGAAGNVVTTGFKPAFVLLKQSSASGEYWHIWDNTRNATGQIRKDLYPNLSNAESNYTSDVCTFTDTGFTINDGNGAWNGSGATYIYMAFKDTREYAFWLDDSGNNNDWQPNGGITTESTVTDTPTPYLGGGNYATLNPLAAGTASYLSGGNLNASISPSNTNVFGTFQIPSSGKWYWEYQITTIAGGGSPMGGISTTTASSPAAFYRSDGTKLIDGTGSAYGASYTTTDTVGVAVDVDGGTITFYKNNSSQGAITYASAGYYPTLRSNVGGDVFNINFGQRPFAYTPPTGFKALHTGNLPDSTIVDGSKHFDATLWTGNGGANITVTGVDFQPDLVWAKRRSAADGHGLFDAVRGTNLWLQSNTTGAETTFGGNYGLLSFNSDGFTMGNGSSVNFLNATYVGWSWKAGGTGVTNTDGSITSTVSANPTAGFSIVTYTGTGANATVGHSLGSVPSMVIVKKRSSATSSNWMVYHVGAGTGNALNLNGTSAAGGTYWNNTAPTSTVFSLDTNANYNSNTDTFVAYCFAEVESYSKFGSYLGNGSADGTFVYTGFRPKFLLGKASSTTSQWFIWDTERNTYNVLGDILYPNLSAAEVASALDVDFLSNGFKFREGGGAGNDSGVTYIYMAFAENPFKNSLAR